VADLFAANIDTLKLSTAFEDREKERKERAGKHSKRVNEYLDHIERTKRIEDRMDSDDIAREIVATPETYATLPVRKKAILVQEMLTGWVGGDDQRSILVVLHDVEARGQLRELLRIVTVPRLRSQFGGAEGKELEQILKRAGAAP
jgi:hypothetical protein